MKLEDAIRGRRSIRKYQDRDVPIELINKAIELASYAPNNGNFQAWQFYVIKDKSVIDRIADLVQSKVDLMAGWPEAEECREVMCRHQEKCAFFRDAPVNIVIGYGGYAGPADKVLRLRGEGDPEACEMIMNRAKIASRAQTVASAITLMSLALHSYGLGSCWLAGPMVARKEISEILQAPKEIELFAMVSVGWPAEEKEAAPRRPLEEIVRVI